MGNEWMFIWAEMGQFFLGNEQLPIQSVSMYLHMYFLETYKENLRQ